MKIALVQITRFIGVFVGEYGIDSEDLSDGMGVCFQAPLGVL